MKINIKTLLVASALLLTSCDEFLEKPDTTGTVDQEAIYSSSKNAFAALMTCYNNVLRHGWPGGMGIGHCTFGAISGEVGRGYSWHGSYNIVQQGLSVNGTDGSDAGAEHYGNNWKFIRQCFLVKENIEQVPDMTDAEKSRLRGEAYTIMASRYFDAFRNFGGLCLVKKAYAVGEEFQDGRATAKETVNYIDSLIQKAIAEPGFIWNVPNSDIGQWSGRLTRASARALRAKVWMFAASPLFNNAAPYMEYTPDKTTEFTNREHVWFGGEDKSLWNKCLQYCDEFFQDNAANGNYYQLVQPATKDEAGYRTAYRRAYRYRNDETHHEKLFDAHPTTTLSGGAWGWGWAGFALDCYRQGGAVPTNELVECFGMQDGRNFPYADLYGAGKNPDGIDIFADRDPRLYETVLVPRQSLPAGFDYAGYKYADCWVNGAMYYNAAKFGDANADDARSNYRKFKWMLDYDSAKMDDEYIGVSYIRLAEMYLIRAEARAETGDFAGALDDLDVVRSRVGLGRIEKMNPGLNLTSNKENLIDEILRSVRNAETVFMIWYVARGRTSLPNRFTRSESIVLMPTASV